MFTKTKAFVAAILFTILAGCWCSSPEGEQKELQKEFSSRIATLEKLREMSGEDHSVVRIAPKFTRLENNWSWPRPPEKLGFSTNRWNEYRRLFNKIGVTDGLQREDGDTIFFFMESCGLVTGGRSYGYAYVPKDLPNKIINQFSDFHQKGIGYVPLSNHWYIFVEISG